MQSCEERRETKISFVCEQAGLPEQELKNALIPVLNGFSPVQRAYLVRVLYRSSEQTDVALCLSASAASVEIVNSCAQEFRKLFNSEQCLDILFLKPEQETELSKVCRPFFRRQQAGS
jgi:hypothetical protein